MLKDHAISIITRLKPSKRGYFNMVWEAFGFKKLLNYKLEGIFKDEMEEKKFTNGGMQFRAYLKCLFNLVF